MLESRFAILFSPAQFGAGLSWRSFLPSKSLNDRFMLEQLCTIAGVVTLLGNLKSTREDRVPRLSFRATIKLFSWWCTLKNESIVNYYWSWLTNINFPEVSKWCKIAHVVTFPSVPNWRSCPMTYEANECWEFIELAHSFDSCPHLPTKELPLSFPQMSQISASIELSPSSLANDPQA